MKLKVIGSSSKGNGYLFEGANEALIIETGCKFASVKEAINFKVGKIVGALVTHSHNDHAGHMREYIREGVKVYSSQETITESGLTHHNLMPIQARKSVKLGGFRVLPFEVVHDVKCFGYLVEHAECGRFVFITDTHYSPARFKGLNNIVIEANYAHSITDERLENGTINKAYYDRVLRSHMSLETTINFLMDHDLDAVNNIVLIHLSDGNSDTNLFKSSVEQLTGKPTHIADSGMEINFNKQSF